MQWLIFVCFLIPSLANAESGCLLYFDAFLSKFERDRQFQEANTIFPLRHSFIDLEAESEPGAVDAPLSKAEVVAHKNPIFPSPAMQKEIPFVKAIKGTTPSKSAVHLQKPDTGYLLIYHFQNMDGCWKLVDFEDAST